MASRKRFKFGVYSSAGVFKKFWGDVTSIVQFTQDINAGFSELVIDLARDSTNFGEDADVKHGNQVKIWCFDAESGTSGVLVYSGYISRYEPSIVGRKESLRVTLLSYWHELGRYMLESAGDTKVTYTTYDPGNLLKDLLDKFTAAGGKLDYSGGTVDLPGTSVTYEFNTALYQDAVQKVVDLCPAGWYLRIDADDLVYLKAKSTTADHLLILGQHISEFKPEKRTESMINSIYFRGGDSGGILYKKYERATSIANYGKFTVPLIDERIKNYTVMDTIANRILDTFDAPEIRVTLKVIDSNNAQGKGYDIESLKVGQTVKIENATNKSDTLWDVALFDVDVFDYSITNASAILLQIQRKEYHPDYCVLELSNRLPDIARRIEDINKALVDAVTADNPTAPI